MVVSAVGWVFWVLVATAEGHGCGMHTAPDDRPWPTREACEAARAAVAHGELETRRDGVFLATTPCFPVPVR